MKKFMRTLKIWFGRDTSSVVGSLVKRECEYSILSLKGGVG